MEISNETYKEILELIPIPCVDGVIVRDGKVLLVKRKNEPAKGMWFLPGGRILKNEKLENAVIRKTKEETGLDVKVIQPLIFDETIYDEPSMEGVTSGAHTINVTFLLEVVGGEVILDRQGSEFLWAEKMDESWHPYVKKVINASNVFS